MLNKNINKPDMESESVRQNYNGSAMDAISYIFFNSYTDAFSVAKASFFNSYTDALLFSVA